ncbi:MAG: Fic family protein [Patescibacteria group bacterium]
MENFNKFEKTNRENRAEALIRFLKQSKNIEEFNNNSFQEIFKNEETKRNFLANLENQDFLNLLTGLNGILRDKNKKEWERDGEDVSIGSDRMIIHMPPAFEDRKSLLEETLETAKQMNKKNKNLEDIALLFLVAIREIHAFADGNGRSARFIYKLLTTDIKDNESIKQVLTYNGREKIDIRPSYIATKQIENDFLQKINKDSIDDLYAKENINFLKFNPDVTIENKKYFLTLLENDKKNFFIAILNFLKNNPVFDQKTLLKKLGKNKYISVDYLLEKINNKQIDEILSEYKKIKKEAVNFLIHSIAEPENENFKLEIAGEQKTVKDILTQ